MRETQATGRDNLQNRDSSWDFQSSYRLDEEKADYGVPDATNTLRAGYGLLQASHVQIHEHAMEALNASDTTSAACSISSPKSNTQAHVSTIDNARLSEKIPAAMQSVDWSINSPAEWRQDSNKKFKASQVEGKALGLYKGCACM